MHKGENNRPSCSYSFAEPSLEVRKSLQVRRSRESTSEQWMGEFLRRERLSLCEKSVGSLCDSADDQEELEGGRWRLVSDRMDSHDRLELVVLCSRKKKEKVDKDVDF